VTAIRASRSARVGVRGLGARLLLIGGLLVTPGVSTLGAPSGASEDARAIRLEAPVLEPDGAGGAFVAWREAGGAIVVRHVAADGAKRWPSSGLRAGSSVVAPRLAADGAGGVLVAWLDAGGVAGVRVQRFAVDGTPLWTDVSVVGSAGAGASFALVADGAGGALLAWEAGDAATCCTLVVQRLDPSGAAAWGDTGRLLASAGAAVAGSLAAAGDAGGGIRVAFATRTEDGGDGPIVLHRLAADGQAPGAVVIVARAALSGALAMSPEPAGGVVIAWAERDGAGLRAQRVDAAGRPAWTADGVPVADTAIAPADLGLVVDGLGRTTLVWQDVRDGSAGCPDDCVTSMQRLRADGGREWGADGRPLGTLPALGPRVAAVGDEVVAAWQHCPASTCAGATEIRVEMLGESASPSVAEAPLDSRTALVGDGAGGAIVAWWDCATGVCAVRTQRVAAGAPTATAAASTGPDLLFTALTAPALAAPGQPLIATNTVRNAGASPAGAFRIGFYLSANASAPSGLPIGSRSLGALAAGASLGDYTAVTIPRDAPAGRMFLVAVADDLNAVNETNEGNNVRSVPLTIVKPDLVVSAVTAPATGTIGGTLVVGTTVQNLTAGPVSGSFTVGIYLSANASIDPAVDVRVGGRTLAGLAGSAVSVASTPVSIPRDLVPGSYFVGAIADVDHLVPEGNTSNNARVAVARTAFRVAVTSFTPAAGPVGTPVTISGASLPAVKEVHFFNGVNVSSFTLLPPTALRTTVPSGATSGPITLAFTGGNVSSATAFRVTPRITSFAPTVALVSGSITITGTTLGGAVARIGSVPAPVEAASNTDTEVRITVPATAQTGRITITTPGGTTTAATDLIVVRRPTISGFTPTSAPVGATVTITGTQFAAASNVSFNAVPAGPPTALSPTSLRSVVPVGAVTGPLTVTNPAGNASSVAIFHVAPRITGFSPPSGLPGANVSITGTTFGGATAVRFGGVPGVITSSNASVVVATVPATAPTGRITVVTPDGQSTSAADFLVIRRPTLAAVTPASAAVGASVTLSGTNLASASAVTFFDGVAVDRRVVLSNSALRVTVPLGATAGRVGVTNAAGSANSSAVFRVLPAITEVSPSRGSVGDAITIRGTTFTDLVAVRIGATAIGPVSANSSQITAIVPPTATTGPVTVTTAAGTATTSPATFEVIRPPTVAAFRPASGPTGTLVTIDSVSAASATAVTFNGVNASPITTLSPTEIQTPVPLLATSGPIGITNPAGSVLSVPVFRVTPSITTFAPTLGPVGAAVTINGSGFVGVPKVLFGTIPTSPTSVSLTALVAPVPAGALTAAITVVTTEGSGNSSTRFTVIRTPTLASFTPPSGIAGTVVTLVGTSLTSTSIVQFNGIGANTSAVNASVTTSLAAIVPKGATTGRITVTNEAGTVTSASDFHVLPSVTGFTPVAGPPGTEVTMTGNALGTTSTVLFGSAVATLVSANASQVVAIVPGTAATGPITVTTGDGNAITADAFEVLGPIASPATFRRRSDLTAF